jgi:hypothetical protein
MTTSNSKARGGSKRTNDDTRERRATGAKRKKGAARKKAATDDERTVELHLPAKFEDRWTRLLTTVRASRSKGSSLWDQQYEAVAEIAEHQPPLYLFKYSSFAKFCEAELGEEERNVRRWMRVAKFFSPQDEARYKVSRLDALVRWAEKRAKKKIIGRFPLDLDAIRITVVRDGERKRVPAIDASPAEIDADVPRKKGSSDAPHRLELAAKRALEAYPALREVRCVFVDGTLSFSKIPAHAGADFAKALAKIDW